MKEEEHLEIYEEVKRRGRDENEFEQPNEVPQDAETALSGRGPGPARKKKEVYH